MSRPRLVSSRAGLDEALAPHRAAGRAVALVPTMGALHEGHASLLRAARTEVPDGVVVVSVFVNPLQFAPGEDLERYPRTLEADLAVCAAEGVDVVLAPGVEDVYPRGTGAGGVTVDPGPLAGVLEGASRPTHFRGVLTVVATLFGLVRPDVAVFGEKDYQQLVLVRRMAEELCLRVRVVGAPTARADDGLALSSRNAFLDAHERVASTALHRALVGVVRDAAASPRLAGPAVAHARASLDADTGVELDYLELTSPDLAPLPDDPPDGTPARVLVAARVGSTRLIDNLPVLLGAGPSEGSS